MNNNRRITRGESFTKYNNWHNDYVTYTPLYCEGKHIINLTSVEMKENRKEAARLLLQMRKNNYKYICYYCGLKNAENDMFKFAAEVKRLGWHYEQFTEIAVWHANNEIKLIEFHGNICEYSCAFRFRIFSIGLVERIAEETGLKVTNYVFNEKTKKYDKK